MSQAVHVIVSDCEPIPVCPYGRIRALSAPTSLVVMVNHWMLGS